MANKTYERYNPWFWIDMETSSLDFSQSEVLEVALVVTDHHLNVWDSLHLVIHHPINILMLKSSNWCKQRFCSLKYGGNGLFDECHYSETSIADATHKMLQFFEYYCTHDIGTGSRRPPPSERSFFDRTRGTNGVLLSPLRCTHRDIPKQCTTTPGGSKKKQALLTGSTVYFDRRIIETHFPLLQKYLSHKNIDVTTMLETAKRFRPDLMQYKPKPLMKHRAMDDIMDSLALYRYLIST
ncbi:FirrV-1-A3 [Feldmannia irregularis virus a]|uniref:FirrV-1-A3 n=1 Tax=Feldmannia irregularis virus a TaxID=231992 RepID=Q6XM84_9PHYC|nr:FirrV-1-A3 [Feldmannia irregularis virus a]AAR26827.1 FirrV-1-A3 [Feldmannia irregularis virus a]